MRVHEAADVALVFRRLHGHVAIGALLRLRRIVERTRSLSGHTAGLPVVVLIESAEPAVVIHRNVEVHLVAGGAKLRRLVAHERLQEDAAMRLGIQLDQEIVQLAGNRIFGRGQFVKLGIFEIEVRLAHGALHVGDGVTHHAAQAGLRFGAMHDLLDGRVHHAGIEHGGIVASATPFRGLRADRVLHVLDRFAIPLIVEGREMVRGAEPLVVDVFVAALAGVRLHEKLAGNFLPAVHLCGTGEERAFGTVAFAIHVIGGHGRILNAVARFPTATHVPRSVTNSRKQREAEHNSDGARAQR